MYAVADKIYSVNGGIEKFISDGDFSKIPALLSACSEDKNNGIKFVNQKTKDSSPGPISTGWQYGGTTNKRINMEINLSTTYFDWVTCQYYFYHEIYIQNQNKNWLGSWKYAATETWIDATWYVSMFYSNGVSYNNSFSFHNIIDNYKVSLNPQTGEYFGGGGTLFVATPPYPDPDPLLEEGWEPIWDNFTTFQASRIGGQSGIYATISF